MDKLKAAIAFDLRADTNTLARLNWLRIAQTFNALMGGLLITWSCYTLFYSRTNAASVIDRYHCDAMVSYFCFLGLCICTPVALFDLTHAQDGSHSRRLQLSHVFNSVRGLIIGICSAASVGWILILSTQALPDDIKDVDFSSEAMLARSGLLILFLFVLIETGYSWRQILGGGPWYSKLPEVAR